MATNIMPSVVPDWRMQGCKRIVHQSVGLWEVVTYVRLGDDTAATVTYLETGGYCMATAHSPYKRWVEQKNNIDKWVKKIRGVALRKVHNQLAIAADIQADCDDLIKLLHGR